MHKTQVIHVSLWHIHFKQHTVNLYVLHTISLWHLIDIEIVQILLRAIISYVLFTHCNNWLPHVKSTLIGAYV